MEQNLPIYPSPPKQEEQKEDITKYLDKYFNKEFIKNLFT